MPRNRNEKFSRTGYVCSSGVKWKPSLVFFPSWFFFLFSSSFFFFLTIAETWQRRDCGTVALYRCIEYSAAENVRKFLTTTPGGSPKHFQTFHKPPFSFVSFPCHASSPAVFKYSNAAHSWFILNDLTLLFC